MTRTCTFIAHVSLIHLIVIKAGSLLHGGCLVIGTCSSGTGPSTRSDQITT